LLLDQLNQTRPNWPQLILKGSDKIPHDEYQKTVQGLEEKKEQLEADISRESAEFRAQARPVTLGAVQAQFRRRLRWWNLSPIDLSMLRRK